MINLYFNLFFEINFYYHLIFPLVLNHLLQKLQYLILLNYSSHLGYLKHQNHHYQFLKLLNIVFNQNQEILKLFLF